MKNIVSSSSRIPRVHVSQLNCPMGHNSSVLPRDTQFLPFEKTTAECRAELTSSAFVFFPISHPSWKWRTRNGTLIWIFSRLSHPLSKFSLGRYKTERGERERFFCILHCWCEGVKKMVKSKSSCFNIISCGRDSAEIDDLKGTEVLYLPSSILGFWFICFSFRLSLFFFFFLFFGLILK